MALSPGTRLGAYEIVGTLGAGGMGEVFRARDHTLARDVALKVLPPRSMADPERVARFEREAKALAALNHPNIGAIYAFEAFETPADSGLPSVRALILELVEGETLADRLLRTAKGRLEPVQALRIARQIADALDAAHEKGIVHRDLKPANIAIAQSDVVKVLDFGLAKLVRPPEGDDTSDAETFEKTRDGAVVGTVAYMSPEQARGQTVDKRTDIWAFGCVLFEMLAGRRAFARDTASDTIAAILGDQPDWSALPPATPEAVRRVLRRCLEKDVRQRLRDIADVRMELDETLSPSPSASVTAVATGRHHSGRPWVIGLAGLIAAAGLGTVVWMSRQAAPTAGPSVTRSTLTLPADHELDTGGGAGPLALSPDGRRLAYVASDGGQTRLYLRNLDAFDPRAIAGTEGAQYPFFSPDGEWVAFFADRKLKRVSLQSGSPITICDAPTLGRGGAWAADGTIVFDPGSAGLLRVSSSGGRPEPLTSRTATFDQRDLSWPQFLPGGRALLATAGRTGSLSSQLAALSLDTMEWHELGPGSQAQYLASGHLIYHAIGVREGELHAVPFDHQSLTMGGKPLAVLDNVFRAQDAGAAYFVVAPDGTLIFAPGGYARALVQVDRNGRRTPLLDERLGFRKPELSPDGSKLAVTIDPRPSQVWVYDLARKSRIAIATEGHNLGSLWTPDGRRVAYATDSPPDIYWRTADGGSAAERLLARDGPQYPTSWSADGRLLIFDDGVPNRYDIRALPLGGTPRALVATPASELGGQLSPDGRWLAYQSNESGRFEIYVRPFPNVGDRKWSISTSGGQRALWSRNGKELFYLVGSGVVSVAVEASGSTFSVGAPQVLFSGPFDTTNANYTVSRDGTHFVMVEVDPHSRPTQLQVVLNWADEVARLAPSQPGR
jgi:Tol biopolymer transport system component/tRNA A-37 threonylcarbamoyl transferase component Bud32